MSLEGKRIVVTGGAGFVGSNLVDRLVESRCKVTVIDDLSYGKKVNLNKNAEFVKADVRDLSATKGAISDADVVYHLAAIATTKESQMGWKDPDADNSVNVIGTLSVLKAVAAAKSSPRIVFTSSAAVYGEPVSTPMRESHPTNPVSPYGISKLAGEKYIYAFGKEYGVKYAILRIFNSYGPRQPRYVMADLMNKLKAKPRKLEMFGTGEQVRDYSYIGDTVNALMLAGEKTAAAGEIFNVGSGKPISIRELAGMIVSLFEMDGKVEVSYTNRSWPGDIQTLLADTHKIEEKLGFKPRTDLKSGLALLKDWIMQN